MDGAECMAIVFNPRSSTELNYDYVTFYKEDPRVVGTAGDELHWGESKYSGGMGGR